MHSFNTEIIMKTGIHPENYRLVAFKDMSNEDIFITKSTVDTKETIEHDGVEYPLVKLEISEPLIPITRASPSWSILPDELTSSRTNIRKFKK